MQKTVLNYGLIAGGIMAALLLATAFLLSGETPDYKNSEILGYAGMLLSFTMIFMGIKSYRDRVAGGVISFGKAFQVGILIAVIACAIYVVAWMIISSTLMTDFMEQYSRHLIEQMQASGATEAEIQKQMAEMEKLGEMYKNPLFKAAITFLEPFPLGLLITLISALILRRKNP